MDGAGRGSGYLSAVRAGRFTDRALTILALIGISMPVFWLAAILLYLFSFSAAVPHRQLCRAERESGTWAYHLILPWVTLAVLCVASTAAYCAPTCSTR